MAQQTGHNTYPLIQQQSSEETTCEKNVQILHSTDQATRHGNYKPGHTNATTEASAKAGAYGGGEAGGLIGNALCCCGGIIGNCIGEKLGEKAVEKTGLKAGAGKVRDKLGNVIGEKNVDKAGEIALTAFGYGDDQFCACFPCMPSSQILFFIMVAFSIYNWYRLAITVPYENGCNETLTAVLVQNNTTVEYPCEFGFHYMVAGAAVWICFLPFYIFTLLGNCWRQCCCCLCDPLVCCATMVDLVKRCCCECGNFSWISCVWHSMCIFQVVWGCCGLHWLVKIFYLDDSGEAFKLYVDDEDWTFLKNVLTSVILDIFLAGSEIFHKILHIRLKKRRQIAGQLEEENAETGYELK